MSERENFYAMWICLVMLAVSLGFAIEAVRHNNAAMALLFGSGLAGNLSVAAWCFVDWRNARARP